MKNLSKIEVIEIKSITKKFIFFKEENTYYHVLYNGRKIYSTYNRKDAYNYKERFEIYLKFPEFIIEENGNGKFRIKEKNSFFKILKYETLDEEYSSIEEAQEYINSLQWKTVKEIHIERNICNG